MRQLKRKFLFPVLLFLATPTVQSQNQGNRFARPELDIESRMRKAQLAERNQKIKSDSEKLLEVATELKQYVDRTNEHVLSLEVLRKAEEMERLARDLKNRMKGE